MPTLKQLTKNFDYVNSDITEENFPLVKRDHKVYKDSDGKLVITLD